MSIIDKIKRVVGHKSYIEPIVDYNIYPDLVKSFAGGSLAESNILIITNIQLFEEQLLRIRKNENVSVAVLFLPSCKRLSVSLIEDSGKTSLGPFTHIINIYKKTDECSFLTDNDDYPSTDDMYNVYQWLQEEVSYIEPLHLYGTICSAYIGDSSQYSKVLEQNMKMCFKGLGEVMGNHSIINNGIVTSEKVPLDEIINSALFLSSKYGQIMAGEVLLLNE